MASYKITNSEAIERCINVNIHSALGATYRTCYNYAGKKYKIVYTYPHTRKCADKPPKPHEPTMARTRCNVRRAIRTVQELALCNEWKWWVTLTFSKENIDRTDIAAIKQNIARWLRNERRNHHGGNLSYLLIPEQHRKGGWHMHGLINGGLMDDDLSSDWSKFDKLPKYIRDNLSNGCNIPGQPPTLLWWPRYVKKWGWCTVERVRSVEACAAYCTKYMTKQMNSNAISGGKALYIASQGLNRAERIDIDDMPEKCLLQSGYIWNVGAAWWYSPPCSDQTPGNFTDYTTNNP